MEPYQLRKSEPLSQRAVAKVARPGPVAVPPVPARAGRVELKPREPVVGCGPGVTDGGGVRKRARVIG